MSLEKRYVEALERLPSFIKRRGNINSDKNWDLRGSFGSGVYYAFKETKAEGFLNVEKYIKPILGLNADIDKIIAKQFFCALQRTEVSLALFNSSEYRSNNNISDEFLDKLNPCLMNYVLSKIQEVKTVLESQDQIYEKSLLKNQKKVEAGKKPLEVEKPYMSISDIGFQEIDMMFHTLYFQRNFVKELKAKDLDDAFFRSSTDLYVGYGDRNLISGNMAHCLFMKSMISVGRLYVEKYGVDNKDSYYKNVGGSEFFKVTEKVSCLNEELFELPSFGKNLDKEELRWGNLIYLFEASEIMTSNVDNNEKKIAGKFFSTSERKSIKEFLEEFSAIFLNVAETNEIISSNRELGDWFNAVPPNMWRNALRDAEKLGSESLKKYKLNYLVEFVGVDHFAEVRTPSPFGLKAVAKEKADVEADLAKLLKERKYSVKDFTSSMKEVNVKSFYKGLVSIKKMKDADDWDNRPKYDKMMELYRTTNAKKQFVASPASLTQYTIDKKVKKVLSKVDGSDLEFPSVTAGSDSFKL